MQVSKIQEHIARFPAWLGGEAAVELLPIFEIQANWQKHFNVEARDLAASYDRAYHANSNRRHYRRRGFEPKDALLHLINFAPDLTREVFRDLFEETRELDGRLNRSVVFLDELWKRYRKAKPSTPLSSHYHDDGYRTLTTYLAAQYPERYAPYSTEVLRTSCQRLGARDVPDAADVARQVKLLKLLRNFLMKDEPTLVAFNTFVQDTNVPEGSALLPWAYMEMLARD